MPNKPIISIISCDIIQETIEMRTDSLAVDIRNMKNKFAHGRINESMLKSLTDLIEPDIYLLQQASEELTDVCQNLRKQ